MNSRHLLLRSPFFFPCCILFAALAVFCVLSVIKYHHKRQFLRQLFYDSLTGLTSRDAFLTKAHHLLHSSDSIPAAFLFLGLDHMALVNELLGEDTGDQVIRSAALALRRVFRQNDLVGRFGGDQFMVLIRNVPEFVLIMRLKQVLEYLQADYKNSTEQVSVSSSIGVVYCTDVPEQNVQEILEMADAELVRAKDAGRNCYSIREL